MSKTKRLIEEKESFEEDFYNEYGFYPPEDWDEDTIIAYEEMVGDLEGLDTNDLY